MHTFTIHKPLFCIIGFTFSLWLLAVTPAAAQVTVTDGDLNVMFSSAPLFSAPTTSNIAPAATRSGTITVQNTGVDTETVLLAARATSSTGLADGVELTVTEAGTVRYTGSFADFFATSSVVLSDLAAGATTSYALTAKFLPTSGNEFQGTTMSFDLRIGFMSGAGVTGPSGGGGSGGGGSGTLINPPTPGDTNTPAGQVEGLATSNGLTDADQFWPWWDTAVAALGDAVRPDRGSNQATSTDDVGSTATGTVADTTTDSSDTDGAVAGIADNLTNEAFCILWWFVLLALLGVLGRYVVRYEEVAAAAKLSALRTQLLIFTVAYLLVLYSVSLLTTITALVGWLLFAVWALYQLYDQYRYWQLLREISLLRLVVLGLGLLALFLLPEWVSWLCAWW